MPVNDISLLDLSTTLSRLTPRHREILRCKCQQGMTNDETAYSLGVTQTIKNHITIILARLSVASVQQACYIVGEEVGRMSVANAQRSELV